MWILLDAIIVAIFFFTIIRCAKKGFIKSLCGIGVTVVSIVIALNFNAPFASFLRNTVVYENLTDSVNTKIEEYISSSLDEEKVLELFESAPEGINVMLSAFGTDKEDVMEKLNEIISSGEENAAEKISEYIVTPAAVTLSNALSVILLFFASVIILNLALWILDLVFKLPVLNTANKFGGVLIGVVISFLLCFLFCTVVHISLPYLSSIGVGIDAESAESTLLFSKLANINPIGFLYK